MFQDIGVSKDLNEQFRRHLSETLSNEPLDIDFQIQVSGVEKKLALREIKSFLLHLIPLKSFSFIFISRCCHPDRGPSNSLVFSPYQQSWNAVCIDSQPFMVVNILVVNSIGCTICQKENLSQIVSETGIYLFL